MYIILSLIPVIFNYAYIFLEPFHIPLLYLVRFLLNWLIFPVCLVWINFSNVITRKIRPFFSGFMSFLVMVLCYGSVYMTYYMKNSVPLDDFGVKSIFLTNLYIFLPFAIVVIINIIYNLTLGRAIKKRKKEAKRAARRGRTKN